SSSARIIATPFRYVSGIRPQEAGVDNRTFTPASTAATHFPVRDFPNFRALPPCRMLVATACGMRGESKDEPGRLRRLRAQPRHASPPRRREAAAARPVRCAAERRGALAAFRHPLERGG